MKATVILLGLIERIKQKPSRHHCQKYYKREYQEFNAILAKNEKPAILCFFYLLAQIQHINKYSSSLSCQLKLISFLLHFEHRFRFLMPQLRVLTLSFLIQQKIGIFFIRTEENSTFWTVFHTLSQRLPLWPRTDTLSHRFRQRAKLN